MRLLNASHAWRTPLIVIDSWPASTPLCATQHRSGQQTTKSTDHQSERGTAVRVRAHQGDLIQGSQQTKSLAQPTPVAMAGPGAHTQSNPLNATPGDALAQAVRRLRQWWTSRENNKLPTWAANDAPKPSPLRTSVRQAPIFSLGVQPMEGSKGHGCTQGRLATARQVPHSSDNTAGNAVPRSAQSGLCAGGRVLTGFLGRGRPGQPERGTARKPRGPQTDTLHNKPGRRQAANSSLNLGDAQVVLRGRMADVCAELDRLVAIEAIQARHQQRQPTGVAPAH